MKTNYKNIISTILFSQLILGASVIPVAIAMNVDEDAIRRGVNLPIRPGETATDLQQREKDEGDRLVHNANMAKLSDEYIEMGWNQFNSASSLLSNHRWVGYSLMTGFGSGLWLTKAFGGPEALQAGTAYFMFGGAAVAVAVAGGTRYVLKNYYKVDVDYYVTTCSGNVGATLFSLIPWAGFIFTPSAGRTPNGTPAPTF